MFEMLNFEYEKRFLNNQLTIFVLKPFQILLVHTNNFKSLFVDKVFSM